MASEVYSYIVEYTDQLSGVVTKYQLSYYASDHSVEMFDFKVDLDVTRRRLFLKRTVVPSLRLEDLFIGAKVSVCSRVLTVLDYADSTTRNTFASKQEKTLALIAANSDMGKVLSLISEKSPANNGGNSSRGTTPRSARPRDESFHSGFVVERMRCVYLTSKEVLGFQRAGAGHRGLSEGLYLALELHKENAVEHWLSFANDLNRHGRTILATGSNSSSDAKNELSVIFGKRPTTAYFSNCTLCIIKPHAVFAGHTGEILEAILSAGFQITALEMETIPLAKTKQFLEPYNGVLYDIKSVEQELSNGLAVILEVWSPHSSGGSIVNSFRELCGPFDPDTARSLQSATIRARFGVDRARNAVHCTDLAEDGEVEVGFFFGQADRV